MEQTKAEGEALETLELFGIELARLTFRSALDLLKQWARQPGPRQVVTADATMLVLARQQPDFARILQQADLVVPDGAGVLWAAARLGTPLPERVPGCDLAERLCAELADTDCTFYFLGAAPGVAAEAANRLKRRFPLLRIVGTRHGYFPPEAEPEVVAEIAALKPDVVFCALGIPKQEFFLFRHKHELGANLLMGVGGTLDVLSGRVKRAGKFWQDLHLEWLYRTLSQPRKRLPRALKLAKLLTMTLEERRKLQRRARKESRNG